MSLICAPKSEARDELNKLLAGVTIKPKRAMSQTYRYTMASGKLGGKKIPRKVTYAKNAYRADKKRVGNSPNVWGWTAPDVKTYATRDV